MVNSTSYPRIAVVSDFSGVVARGAERTADDWQRHLRGDVTIVSLAGCRTADSDFSNVSQAKATVDAITRHWAWLDAVAAILFRDKFRPLVGTYDFFSSVQRLNYSFAQRLPAILDNIKPHVAIAMTGFHAHRVLSYYCREKQIVYLGLFGGGPSNAMRAVARKLNDGIAVQTPFELQFIRSAEPRAKSVLIPLGVDLEAFYPAASDDPLPSELLGLDHPIIFSASAFYPNKRLQLLIDAVGQLKRGSLVMAGDGPARHKLLQFANQSLGEQRFRYMGTLNRRQLLSLYQFTDVFSLPSINEPFGNVLLEAMACNKPIVATNDLTRRWIVGGAGILVDVMDPYAFADALRRAGETSWGDKPRERAQFFSLESVIAAWNDLIVARLDGDETYISRIEKEL